jgi:hypothetical protein
LSREPTLRLGQSTARGRVRATRGGPSTLPLGILEVLEAPQAARPARKDTAMTTMDHTPRQVSVKVSAAGDKLITSGANYLRMSKKDLVEAAVAFYLDARREEMQAGMRELLSELDGSRASRVAMLAGMTREELDSVGGVEEDD